jgi:hypothetical protein
MYAGRRIPITELEEALLRVLAEYQGYPVHVEVLGRILYRYRPTPANMRATISTRVSALRLKMTELGTPWCISIGAGGHAHYDPSVLRMRGGYALYDRNNPPCHDRIIRLA